MGFGLKVVEHLSASNRALDSRVVERLRVARTRALAVHDAGGRGGFAEVFLAWRVRLRLALSPAMSSSAMLLVVLALFFGGGQWSNSHRIEAQQAIDTALLIDDLPIEAYLDPEFRAWLARESRS
jgi:hypothetical protein